MRKLRISIRLAKPMYAVRDTAMVRVVRSVQVALALEWLVARIDPRVVLVRRHPFDVIASRVKLGFLQHSDEYLDERAVAEHVERWPCPPRPTNGDAYTHLVWLTAFEMTAFDETAAAHPEFVVVDHEAMCLDPLPQFRRLAADLGLEWTDQCDRYLQTSDTPGDGFDTKRVSAAQSGKWKTVLSEDQVQRAREMLEPVPSRPPVRGPLRLTASQPFIGYPPRGRTTTPLPHGPRLMLARSPRNRWKLNSACLRRPRPNSGGFRAHRSAAPPGSGVRFSRRSTAAH